MKLNLKLIACFLNCFHSLIQSEIENFDPYRLPEENQRNSRIVQRTPLPTKSPSMMTTPLRTNESTMPEMLNDHDTERPHDINETDYYQRVISALRAKKRRWYVEPTSAGAKGNVGVADSSASKFQPTEKNVTSPSRDFIAWLLGLDLPIEFPNMRILMSNARPTNESAIENATAEPST